MNLPDPQRTYEPNDKFERLIELLDRVKTVMVVTSPNAMLSAARARPMTLARRGDDCTLYFLSSVTASLVQELHKDDLGMCTARDDQHHASLAGIYNVVDDRALVLDLWSDAASTWFPKGPTDPDLRVIVFRPTTAELWDLSGTKGVGYFIDVARAWLAKEPSKSNDDSTIGIAVTQT